MRFRRRFPRLSFLTADGYRWDSLPDPDQIAPKNESSLKELLGEIRATVGQEAQIVQAVFPNPPFVMQVFLQRVFAQSVWYHCSLFFKHSLIFLVLWSRSKSAWKSC